MLTTIATINYKPRRACKAPYSHSISLSRLREELCLPFDDQEGEEELMNSHGLIPNKPRVTPV